MIKIEDIKEGTVIVSENQKEEMLLSYEKLGYFHHIHFLHPSAFLDCLTFTSTLKTLVVLKNKYNLHIDVAKKYIEVMRYIKEYPHHKELMRLHEMKAYLSDSGLLTYHKAALEQLRKQKLYIDMSQIDIPFFVLKEQFPLLEEIEHQSNDYIPEVTVFEKELDEIEAVAYQIASKLEEGVQPSSIRVIGVTPAYESWFKRIFSWYHIKVAYQVKTALIDTAIGVDFMQLIKRGTTVAAAYESVVKKYQHKEEASHILNALSNALLEVVQYEITDTEVIIDCLNTSITNKQTGGIILDTIHEDSFTGYTYFIGCHEGTYPVQTKDEQFFRDAMKEECHIKTSEIKNIEADQALRRWIKKQQHLFISYSKIVFGVECSLSSVLKEYEDIIHTYEQPLSKRYSMKYDQIKYANLLDTYHKYGTVTDDLKAFVGNKISIPYQSFHHAFQGVTNKNREQIRLSYTSLNTYALCPYRYYLDYVLRIKPRVDQKKTELGNFYHDVLSKRYDEDFDLEKVRTSYKASFPWSKRERFFIDLQVNALFKIIDVLKKQELQTDYKNVVCEQSFEVMSKDKYVSYVGKIDKIMTMEEDSKQYLCLVDYKTGNYDLSLGNITYGLSLQLPYYLFLLRHSPVYKEVEATGFYFQSIAPIIERNKKGSKEVNMYLDNMKLDGYSVNEEDKLKQLDHQYKEDSMIRGMRLTKNGFSHSAKLLSGDAIMKLIDKTEEVMKEMTEKITNGVFDIKPVMVDQKDVGCKYCPYQDICFKTYQDYHQVKSQPINVLLGGD